MLAGSQRQGRTCCLELGCGQDKVNIPARKLCLAGGGRGRTLHSPLPHESQRLDWAGHPGDIKCPIRWEGSPALGVTLEFSAALNFAQETKGLKEGKGDVTRSRRGQRVEKSKAICAWAQPSWKWSVNLLQPHQARSPGL